MRNVLAIAIGFLVLVAPAVFAADPALVGDGTVAVTDASTYVDMGSTASTRTFTIGNRGSNPVFAQAYYDGGTVTTPVATADSPLVIPAGQTAEVTFDTNVRYWAFICGSGLTSTVSVAGIKSKQ